MFFSEQGKVLLDKVMVNKTLVSFQGEAFIAVRIHTANRQRGSSYCSVRLCLLTYKLDPDCC